MNIKFKLVPKLDKDAMGQLTALKEEIAARIKAESGLEKPVSLDELLFGKEINFDELISEG